jgi:hypothetical protein
MNSGKLKGPEKSCKEWENVNYGNVKAGFYCTYYHIKAWFSLV